MATYIILNILFALAIFFLLGVKIHQPSKRIIVTGLILISMTIIFDSLIVVFDIVRYDSSKITSLYLGFAPIEDYIYALVAIVVIPAIWKKLGRKEK